MRAGGFEQLERAAKICLEIGRRVLYRIPNPRLRREVDNHVGPIPVKQVQKQTGGFDRCLGLCECSGGGQPIKPGLLQVHVIVVVHAVDTDNLPSLVEQRAADEVSDKAGGSGNKRGCHGNFLCRTRRCGVFGGTCSGQAYNGRCFCLNNKRTNAPV